MTGSARSRCRLTPLLLLLALLPNAARAEHPIGSPAWLRAQQGGRDGVAPDGRSAEPGQGIAAQQPIPETAQGPIAAPDGAGPDAAAAAPSINPLSRMALGELKAFKGRPLFAPSRRPPVSEPVAVQVVATEQPVVVESPAPDLRLIGIVAGVDRAVAVLGRSGGGPPVSVRMGDQVETWRVHLIAPDRVVLRQGEREQAYRLFTAAAGVIRPPAEASKGRAPSVPRLSTAQPPPEP